MLINSPIRNRTRVSRFKVSSDNHYTIGEKIYFKPVYKGGLHEVGFEPTRC